MPHEPKESDPMILVDEEVRDQVRDELIGQGLPAISARREEMLGRMRAVRTRIEPESEGADRNWTNSGLAESDKPGDHIEAFLALHSQLAGATEAYRQTEAMEVLVDDIESGAVAEVGYGRDREVSAKDIAEEILSRTADEQGVALHEQVIAQARAAGIEGKGAGDHGVIVEYLKARGERGIELAYDLPRHRAAFTTGQYPTFNPREPGTELMPRRMPLLSDYFIRIMMPDGNQVIWMKETVNTNNVGGVAEGAAYLESVFTAAQQSDKIVKVGTIVEVTEEALEDDYNAQDYLDVVIPEAVNLGVDGQLASGTGPANNQMHGALGELTNDSKITTSADTAVGYLDAVVDCMARVFSASHLQATDATINPGAFATIAKGKGNDQFFAGSPYNGFQMSLWGLPMQQSTVLKNSLITDVPILICNWSRSRLYVRSGLTVVAGFVGDNFKEDKSTLKAKVRMQAVHRRAECLSGVKRKAAA